MNGIKEAQLLYKKRKLNYTNPTWAEESKDYFACTFLLDNKKVIYRLGKITPKKIGHFVTFWKRNNKNITIPFDKDDDFDIFIVATSDGNKFGQFIFPKTTLIEHNIITNNKKEDKDNSKGKLGFRVYPSWTKPESKQAIQTQKWQLQYFFIN